MVKMKNKNDKVALVSVIMPTYNQAEYIEAAIESVISQSYPNFELIVIDNYSIDLTFDVVNLYSDPRIKYLKFDNKGVIAAARNYGVSQAKGSILAFLDSDDIWLPEMLAKQTKLLNENVALVSSSFEPIGNVNICRHHLNYIDENEVKSFFYNDIIHGNPIMTSSVILFKKDFELSGGFNESLSFRFIEDWELWLRLAYKKKVIINGSKLLKYRISYKKDRDVRDVKKRTLLIIKKHFELRYINYSTYRILQGNCNVDIGKAHLDVNDRSGINYYLKGLWSSRSIQHKIRSIFGLALFFTPLFLRERFIKLFYNINYKISRK